MKKLPKINTAKLLKAALPYIFIGLVTTKLGQAYRMVPEGDVLDKMLGAFLNIGTAFQNPLPSFHPFDLMVGAACGVLIWFIVYQKAKNARKYRRGAEYGTARWGTAKDIEPFIDPDFSQNILLSDTERLTLGKIADPEKRNVNLNVLVIGGSGSGKTRYHIKPNLLQMNASYVCSDPKGTVIEEVGRAMIRGGYKIKVLNTIDFSCSMHYNPFVYLHSETDILTLVTVIMTNTQGEAKGGDDFWQKAEALLYQALISYIYYEAPAEEKNMNTLLDMLNACECREDDENFKSAVDLLFEQLESRNPDHFAVRQYKKFKMAAGVISLKRLLNHHFLRNWSSKMIKKSLEAYFLPKTRNCTFLKTFSKDGNILPRQSGYSVRNFSNRHKIQRNLKKLRYYLVKQRPKDGLSERNFFEDPYTNLDNGAACP